LAVDAVVTFHKFIVDSTQISNTKSAMAPTGERRSIVFIWL
jgi:hypothetical protein